MGTMSEPAATPPLPGGLPNTTNDRSPDVAAKLDFTKPRLLMDRLNTLLSFFTPRFAPRAFGWRNAQLEMRSALRKVPSTVRAPNAARQSGPGLMALRPANTTSTGRPQRLTQRCAGLSRLRRVRIPRHRHNH